MAWLLLAGIGMTGLCVLLTTIPQGATSKPAWLVHLVGWTGTVFFGACLLVGVVRLFRRRPALVIDRQGFVDLSSLGSVGRVTWLEVRGFRLTRIKTTRFVVVDVVDPRHFIDRGNFLLRLVRSGNMRVVGSPLAFSSATLDIGFDELVSTLERFHGQATGRPANTRA